MTRITRKPWILTFALTLLLVTPFAVVHAQSQDAIQDQNDEQVDMEANPQSGLTLRGTVKEVGDDKLVVETVTGVEHIEIPSHAELPEDISKGDEVMVDYTRNNQGVAVATLVRPDEGSSDQLAATPTDEEARTDELDRQTDTDRAETEWDQDVERDQQVATEADTAAQDRDRLPQTASGLPLAGLVGLLSLIGAFALRSFRS